MTCSTLQQFGEFTSGVGVHYEPSVAVDVTNQFLASKLIVGRRVHPHVFVRASDGRPYEMQDLLPADACFKVLVFTGDTNHQGQMRRVRDCADQLGRPDSFFKRFGKDNPAKVFSLLIFSSVSVSTIDFTGLIRIFKTHWSRQVHLT